VDNNIGLGETPLKMNAQEPLCQTHKINLNPFFEKKFEECFNGWILAEIHKVVSTQAQGT
jgi:hypothetical protein